jgi:hypothetical protein
MKVFSPLPMGVEVGFIIFLFYSNLLTGEMERTANGRDKGLLWDLHDILVAVVAALIRLRASGASAGRSALHRTQTVSL